MKSCVIVYSCAQQAKQHPAQKQAANKAILFHLFVVFSHNGVRFGGFLLVHFSSKTPSFEILLLKMGLKGNSTVNISMNRAFKIISFNFNRQWKSLRYVVIYISTFLGSFVFSISVITNTRGHLPLGHHNKLMQHPTLHPVDTKQTSQNVGWPTKAALISSWQLAVEDDWQLVWMQVLTIWKNVNFSYKLFFLIYILLHFRRKSWCANWSSQHFLLVVSD